MKTLRRIIAWFAARRARQWEHGTCNGRPARRHRRSGEVQFVLWKAGEQGHTEDYWINFHENWWAGFKPATEGSLPALPKP